MRLWRHWPCLHKFYRNDPGEALHTADAGPGPEWIPWHMSACCCQWCCQCRRIPGGRMPRAITPASCRAIAMAIFLLTAPNRQARPPRRKSPDSHPPARQHPRMSTIAGFVPRWAGGVTETRRTYTYDGGGSYVKVDCKLIQRCTRGGLDKRNSLDSLQQTLFFSVLTRKAPEVVIYDTNDREERFEYRVRTAYQKARVR